MFTVDLEGLDELQRDFGRAVEHIVRGTQRAVQLGVWEGAAEARDRHTFKNRSGRLQGSIQGYATGSSGDEATGVIKADMPYASFIEEGTQPHIIRPRSDHPRSNGRRRGPRYLAFTGRGGGLVFARIVRHPGTKPMPFMGLAYLKAERVIIREIEVAIVEAQEILDR